MLLLLHALIPCVATYILSFGLHIIIVVCSHPCVAAYRVSNQRSDTM